MKRFLSLVILALLMCMAVALVINAETTQCTEHVFGKYEMTTPPTCERDGLITYICTVCGATETSTVEARHDYHSKVEKVADCYNEGSIVHTCLTCGDTKTETTSKTHTYRSEIIVAPTCDTAGETKYTCSTCGDTYTEATPATHTYSDIKVLYVPTCFYEGSIRFTCSICGETLTESVAKRHSYESEITIPATCQTEGVLRHTCLYCNTTHTDVIPASHDYSGGVTRIEYKDYTQTGIKYIECKNGCGVNEGVIANPIFIFRGYSVAKEYVNEGDLVELTCGYKVDVEALKEYNTVMKDSPLEIGVVGAVVSHLAENEPPLNSATAEPVTITQQAGFVKKIKFNNQGYSNANANLINIDYDRHATYFYFCMYVYDGEKTVYICDDSCRDLPLPISYSMLAEGGDHDDVTHGTSIKFGDIEYSTVKGTEPDSKRLDIITSSANAYKTEQSSASSVQDEDTISSIGSLGSFLGTVPNANALLNYYLELGGDATHYRDLDIQSLITNSTVANSSWLESINNILRASEYLAVVGKTVNIDQTTETQVQLSKSTGLWNKNRDWYLAFIDGFYYTDTDVDNLTVTVAEDGTRTYSATIVYTVIDYYTFYDYRNSDDTSSFLLWGPTRKELAQLHLDGNALDFLIESQLTYTVEWTEGERVGQDELYDRTTETVNESILTVVE